ncbi:MAG: hypothetical protein JWQ66_155 [Mucilaginibacter sp.]|nr:hypothetical protein [Mucilaginibacter sp.]
MSVIVPFVAYCVYYYAGVFKNAPYKFTEFDSIVFQYGPGDSLINKFNSKTGAYQFVDAHDSLVKMNIHLPKEELLYLHRKAAELGFWDFPPVEMGDTTIKHNGMRPPRYLIEFKYKRKTKKVLFDSSFDGDPKLKDANEQLIKEIIKVLEGEEGKEK